MVFSVIPFVFFFLPAFLTVYFPVRFVAGRLQKGNGKISGNTKDKAGNRVILAFSLFFYAWGEPIYIFLMLLTTLVDYTVGRLMERYEKEEEDERQQKKAKRILLTIAVVINLSMLAFFKYADFGVSIVNSLIAGLPFLQLSPFRLPQIALPIGISFYTFQSMSYTIDRYRGRVKAQHSYADYLTYVSMFPQLIAGPIVRYSDIEKELRARTIDRASFLCGFRRFLLGLFRKVLIANGIGALWDEIRLADTIGIPAAWLGLLCFTLQLYYDFSAYSDMAIGLGQMMGFHFQENFRYPLSAVSMTDFWRRWHISLSGWFRDYVYIPLGGNRVNQAKHLRNFFIVWFLTGLWHGASANYILWGLYHGTFLVVEKYFFAKYIEKWPKVLRHLYAVLVIIIGFGIFYFEDFSELTIFFGKLFGVGSVLVSTDVFWYLSNYGVVLAAAVIFAFPVYPALEKKCRCLSVSTQNILYALRGVCIIGLMIVTVSAMVLDTYNPFLYFRF